MANKASWFEVKAANPAAGVRAQVFIFGVIVDYKWDSDSADVTAKEFIDAIKPLGDFDLRINSPGGSVPSGNAIYNAMRRHQGQIDVYVEGMALSMAAVVAMAGARVIMPANALLMIHDPWSYAVGNAADMRKMADTLDKFKTGLVAAYQTKSGMETAEIERMMAEETWITAAEAVELGFADQVEEPVQMAAQFDLTRFRNTPKALLAPPSAKSPAAKRKPEEGAPPMITLATLKKDHPDLVAQIEAAAREGMLARADHETALAAARSEERTAIVALHGAVFGEETGGKFAAIVETGVSAETAKALGVNLAAPAVNGDEASRQKILEGLHNAAPAGLKPGETEASEATERKAAASAIAAGGSVK